MQLVNYQASKTIAFPDSNISIHEDSDMRIRLTKLFQAASYNETHSEIRFQNKDLPSLSPCQDLRSLNYTIKKDRVFLEDFSADERQSIQRKFEEWLARKSHQSAKQLHQSDKK